MGRKIESAKPASPPPAAGSGGASDGEPGRRSGRHAVTRVRRTGRFRLQILLVEDESGIMVRRVGTVACDFPSALHASAFGRRLVALWVAGGYVPVIPEAGADIERHDERDDRSHQR